MRVPSLVFFGCLHLIFSLLGDLMGRQLKDLFKGPSSMVTVSVEVKELKKTIGYF